MLQKMRFGRAPVVFAGLLLLLAVFWLARPMTPPDRAINPTSAYAIQQPAPSAVLAAMPELKTTPVLLEFRTKLCLDCQALAPLLDKLAKQYTGVQVLVYDLDTTRKQRPAIFELFQPVTVPTLVALTPQGHIQQALYERPTETQLASVFSQLSGKP